MLSQLISENNKTKRTLDRRPSFIFPMTEVDKIVSLSMEVSFLTIFQFKHLNKKKFFVPTHPHLLPVSFALGRAVRHALFSVQYI